MRRMGSFEAKNKLGTLLDWVENGEEVVITRRGRDVARLVSATNCPDRLKARRVAQGLLEASRGLSLQGSSIKELIEEGRM